jgi:hypothetical protein
MAQSLSPDGQLDMHQEDEVPDLAEAAISLSRMKSSPSTKPDRQDTARALLPLRTYEEPQNVGLLPRH